jgi:hypothetical protein
MPQLEDVVVDAEAVEAEAVVVDPHKRKLVKRFHPRHHHQVLNRF